MVAWWTHIWLPRNGCMPHVHRVLSQWWISLSWIKAFCSKWVQDREHVGTCLQLQLFASIYGSQSMWLCVSLSLSLLCASWIHLYNETKNVYLRSTRPLLDVFNVGHRGTFCGLCFGCCHCRDCRPDESQRLRKGQRAGKTIKDCNAMNLRIIL